MPLYKLFSHTPFARFITQTCAPIDSTPAHPLAARAYNVLLLAGSDVAGQGHIMLVHSPFACVVFVTVVYPAYQGVIFYYTATASIAANLKNSFYRKNFKNLQDLCLFCRIFEQFTAFQ